MTPPGTDLLTLDPRAGDVPPARHRYDTAGLHVAGTVPAFRTLDVGRVDEQALAGSRSS